MKNTTHKRYFNVFKRKAALTNKRKKVEYVTAIKEENMNK